MGNAPAYAQTRHGQETRYFRRVIKKSAFTNTQKSILCTLVNLWFRHGEREIHPGRELLAKRSGVSVSTVKRCLALFRRLDILQPVCFEKGGASMATQYRLDLESLAQCCGEFIPVFCEGDLVEVLTSNRVINRVINRVTLGEKSAPKMAKEAGHFDPLYSTTVQGFEKNTPAMSKTGQKSVTFLHGWVPDGSVQ